MKLSLKQIREIVAWGMLLVFLFPSLLQFEHLFEAHKHDSCKDVSVHFHEKELGCDIYDFHFSSFSFSLEISEIKLPQRKNSLVQGIYLAPHIQKTHLAFAQRGPPQFS